MTLFSFMLGYGFYITIGLFALGAIVSLLSGFAKNGKISNVLGHGFAVVASVVGLVFGLSALLGGQVLYADIPLSLPLWSGNLPFYIDGLSAFFIATISVVSLSVSIYGLGYQRQFVGKYNLSSFGFFYNLFIASLLLVVTSNHALYFLVAWELMSVTSYFLVIFEHRHKENISSGFLYFIMTQVATAFLVLAFMLLYKYVGSFDFDVIRQSGAGLSGVVKSLVLAAALLGLGTKAGIVPLHIWLPEAHPSAPSHVSALMSGVMIKTAIFMLIRFFFEFVPASGLAWGLVIIILGAVSCLLGVLYALSEHDLKKLLAYHSVENIGIILLGVGSAITFNALGAPILAIVSLVAGLYHVLNHAVFKALLFLGAGSVIMQTGTRNIEHYGGLLKRMPYTGLFFLVGAIAISALPPLNGFVSEWLTFQSLFSGIAAPTLATKTVFISAIVALAFTGGLAAACFVKAFGATFLARPRSQESASAKESSALLLTGMGILSVLCVVLGLGAAKIYPVIFGIASNIVGVANDGVAGRLSFSTISNGVISLPVIALVLVCAILLTFAVSGLLAQRQRERVARTWDCGTDLAPRMEITATGFSRSLITMFKAMLLPEKQTTVEYQDANIRYIAKSQRVTVELPNIYMKYVYAPMARFTLALGQHVKRIQNGNINTYIMYLFITLIALLAWSIR